jgi:hypothetical protein
MKKKRKWMTQGSFGEKMKDTNDLPLPLNDDRNSPKHFPSIEQRIE